jgi:hypothetical protein
MLAYLRAFPRCPGSPVRVFGLPNDWEAGYTLERCYLGPDVRT